MSSNMILGRFLDRLSRGTSSKRRRSARKNRFGLERLEDRILLADVSWTNAAGGSWQTGSNWSTGDVPQPGDRALITLDGPYTVTLDDDVSIAGLTLGGNTGTQILNTRTRTLTINGPSTVEPNGFLLFGGGTIDGTGTLSNQGTVEGHAGGSAPAINISFENATTGSILRFGPDGCGCASQGFHFAQGFTNHGLIESTHFDPNQASGLELSIGPDASPGTLVNAPEGKIHVVPGTLGGLRQFHLMLDNQGTLILDQPLVLRGADGIGWASTNSGTITARAASLTVHPGTTGSFTNTGSIEMGAIGLAPAPIVAASINDASGRRVSRTTKEELTGLVLYDY